MYVNDQASGKARFIADFLGEVEEYSLGFRVRARVHSTMRVAAFAHFQGVCCWLSPQDLYSAIGIGGKGGNAVKWVQSKLACWEKLLHNLGLGLPHVRQALPTGASRVDDDGPGHRVLPYASLSAVAFLAVVANLAGGVRNFGGLVCKSEREKAVHMTECIMAEIGIPQFKLRLNCDANAYHIGRECIGKDPLWLKVEQGMVDLSVLHVEMANNNSAFVVTAHRNSRADLSFLQSSTAMPLSELLIETLKRGPTLYWMAQQFLWQLGDLFDIRLLCRIRPTEIDLLSDDCPMKQAALATPQNKAVVPLTETVDQGSHWRCRRLRLHKYFMAGREAFEGAPVLSLSVDAARVAKRKIQSTALVLPSNEAFWAPPQAVRVPQPI